jgi:hypothetical protein
MLESIPNFLKPFDAYTLRARILPSLLAGLPALALPFVVVPWNRLGLSNLIVTTMSLVLLYAFADVARRSGYRVERRLGTRSTPELWHRANKELPNSTKDLYRPFLAAALKRPEPTEADELERPDIANDFYRGASDWLRDETRDVKKFNILFSELVTYGFRRNVRGLKPVALAMNLIVAIISACIIYYMPPYFAGVPHIEEKLYVVLLVVVLHSIYLVLAVSDQSVREASIAYGKQLIFSCGALMKGTKAPRPRAQKG